MEVPHEERNISRDPQARLAFQESGYDLLPVIEVDGLVITEYKGESQLIEALASAGYLG
jgi:hypothetical protein